MIRLAATVLLALPCAVLAQAPVDRVSLLGEASSLDNGTPDWTSLTLGLSRHWSQRELVGVELAQTRRFGVDDQEIAVSGAMPLSPSVTGNLRLAYSPSHKVLAQSTFAAGLQWEFRKAWLLHGAASRKTYSTTDVLQRGVMLEHYFGNFSALAGVHSVRAFGQNDAVYELRGAWYYNDASSLGVIASAGDEASQVAAGTLALARVRSLALVGRHAIGTGPWSVNYGVHRVRQGRFYTRTGATLGVQRAF